MLEGDFGAAFMILKGNPLDFVPGGTTLSAGRAIKKGPKLLKLTDNVADDVKDANRLAEGAGSKIIFGSDAKSVQKINNEMAKRGWTESSVRRTVDSPYTTRASTNKATGNPATAYYNEQGGYVVIDDVTKEVVQVSDNINPDTWIPDPNIVNPYIPK